MPTPDDRSHDLDDTPWDDGTSSREELEHGRDILFGHDEPGMQDVPADRDVPPHLAGPSDTTSLRVESIDDVDAALFGHAAPSAPAEPAPEAVHDQGHRTAPADLAAFPEEDELAAIDGVPAWIEEDEPTWIDEDEPEWSEEDEPEWSAEQPRSSDNNRGQRRALLVAGFVTLVVIVGAALGAIALNRSDDRRPELNTGNDAATTTASTTTTVVTTLPAPVTSAPPTTTAARPAPTTARAVRRPAPAPQESPPPEPAPEPPAPPPPPPPPPPTSPPSSTTTPPST